MNDPARSLIARSAARLMPSPIPVDSPSTHPMSIILKSNVARLGLATKTPRPEGSSPYAFTPSLASGSQKIHPS
ncbi:hypothetical protein TNCV_2542681 [Trichonephila clavipes]|nr:hypothetical protein TNCV_2542681 [Trichonephila clavipes]